MHAKDGFADGFETQTRLRDVVRGYLPLPKEVAQDIQAQLEENLGITATIDIQESATFIDNADQGNLPGIHLLGWGADYPDASNFLDYHFGPATGAKFGNPYPELVEAIRQAGQTSDEAERERLYGEANRLINENVPMIPVAHGGSATVWKATAQGAHSSPLGNETFRVVSVPNKDTFVWVQNAEPLSLYCADETDGESLRACEQIFDPLLSYKVGGVEVEPNLASALPTANNDLTEWTVKLRPGLKFSDGTPLRARDVVATYAVQWDTKHPLHVGNTGNFDYWTYLFTKFLNAPPEE